MVQDVQRGYRHWFSVPMWLRQLVSLLLMVGGLVGVYGLFRHVDDSWEREGQARARAAAEAVSTPERAYDVLSRSGGSRVTRSAGGWVVEIVHPGDAWTWRAGGPCWQLVRKGDADTNWVRGELRYLENGTPLCRYSEGAPR
ncbi:hypothetical protein [Mycobacteroides chelonae]|uniref:hypothetical protein n=1 Tax=Mycobacteroides chelonae TaxID=1774 RepID=UPI0008A868BB|nr:hypothetical protein [Mycobacteroides chelonae]OHU12845.1 hypothetical protein BKG75_17690 [Mycobacteroides chelonae]